jgi:translocation and assembly module TamB
MIRFNEKTGSFEPILNVRAEIRENTEEGLVRIYLVANNTKLSQRVGEDKDKLGDFSPRFESDSGLTEERIRTILGQNVLGSRGEDSINLETALLLTSDIITQVGVVKAFEKDMRERLGVDLFSVRTHIVQNLLQGVVGTETDIRTENDTPSFGRYLDKTSLFLGKYIGSDLFLELLLQFRADDPLAQKNRDLGGLDIDTELILEWKTPLFLLEWSFFPKHPNELFIFDNKFTFRWKFSF